MNRSELPVAIIGAGPVGLAAAAHLLERGIEPLVLEAGAQVGANVREWAHVRLFSPWRYTVDPASVRLLERYGWQMPPPDDLPTGGDLVARYLQPLAQTPPLRERVQLGARVIAVSRRHHDRMKDGTRETAPFVLRVQAADRHERTVLARAVIDASGTWATPNPLGADGLPALGERAHADQVFYGIPDATGAHRDRYTGRRVMVVGSGHSAINALLDLASLPGTRCTWVLRTANLRRVYGGRENDALPARGQLGVRVQALVDAGVLQVVAPFRTQAIRPAQDGAGLAVIGETPDGERAVIVDEIVCATGARPDLAPLRELRLQLDPVIECAPALAPLIDPNRHSCGTVAPHGEAELRQPERDFYIAGMKSYGRAPTFLLLTGYEQVRSIAAHLAGDAAAARQVQLQLPATGVCHSDYDEAGGACCAPASTGAISVRLDSIRLNG